MSDGTEVSCGLDPLSTDSDENGISDGEEVIDQEVRLSSLYKISDEAHLIPMIVVRGSGDFSRKIDVEDVSYNEAFSDINSFVGHPLDFTHEDITFENSTLSFKLDDAILSEHSIDNLSIVWYNYETNEIEFLDTTVIDGNTISAQVSHFSTFGVIDRTVFFDNLCWNNDVDLTKKGRADIVFAIDTTGSMSIGINKVKEYINKFASGLENKDVNYRFGLVEYRDIESDGINSTINHGWYTDADSFKTAVSALSAANGGDFEESAVDALFTAHNMKYRPSVNKYIVLVTDATYKNGIKTNKSFTMDEEIDILKKNNFCVSVVSAGYSQYNDLINKTNGISAKLDSDFSVSLNELISKIGTESQGGYWIRLSNGSVVKLNKNPDDGDEEFDTDEDGIPDLIELKSKTTKKLYNPLTGKVEDITTWSFYSNPAKKDSDGDGIIDYDDLDPTVFDVRVVIENDFIITFNTGNNWFKIKTTAYDIFQSFASEVTGSMYKSDNYSTEDIQDDLDSLVSYNLKNSYCFYEMCYLGLMDNEGSKFVLEQETDATRDKVFNLLTGRAPKYYKHIGVGNDTDDWEQVTSYDDASFWGKVLSESDFNFSLKAYYKIDFLDCVPAIIAIGILIIACIIIYEVSL